MKLPFPLRDKKEWMIVGPMGPMVPRDFEKLPHLVVDGGIKFSPTSHVWIGDGDSGGERPNAGEVFVLSPHKDQSDLGCALDLLRDDHDYCLHLWGFLGGRKDHELFVLGEVFRFLVSNPESKVNLYKEDGLIAFQFLGTGHWSFEHQGTFSLGSLAKTKVKMTGKCEYPIPKKMKINPLSSFGLSNIAHGKVTLENDGPIFIYYPEGR